MDTKETRYQEIRAELHTIERELDKINSDTTGHTTALKNLAQSVSTLRRELKPNDVSK